MNNAGTTDIIFLYINEPSKPQVDSGKILKKVPFGRWSEIIEIVPLDIPEQTIEQLTLPMGGLEGAALCTTRAWEQYQNNEPGFLTEIADKYETMGKLHPGQAYLLKILDQKKFVEYINNAKVHK